MPFGGGGICKCIIDQGGKSKSRNCTAAERLTAGTIEQEEKPPADIPYEPQTHTGNGHAINPGEKPKTNPSKNDCARTFPAEERRECERR
jgi:hypothetical protein